MIRVLHVVTTMNRGGLETMLMNYYRSINREHLQFDFLVHREEESDYDKEILSLGGRIFHIPVLNPFSPSYYKALDNFFKEHPEYKIVHVHQDCLSSITLKYAKKNCIPVRIGHAHSSSQDKNLKYILKKFFMFNIPKYATHLFACGTEAGDWMFRESDYKVLNNAIDTQSFIFNESIRKKIREEYDIEDNTLIIGHVGRFNYPKNHVFLIEIFNELYKLNKNCKLMLVGSGDLQDEIRNKVNQLRLTDKVIFLGNRSDVNELMQAMDIFVFPSHYEGLPVTLVEAQASGLLVVKSDNVSEQCIMTPDIHSLSLNKDASLWAKDILSSYNSYIRKDTSSYIKEAGYDIEKNAKWLEEFYMREVEKYEK